MIHTLSLLSQATWACGGMMCDPGPLEVQVVQNAERIAFHIDEEAGEVEAHVQVFYEGPPDQFGWVVPVSAQPEVFLSNDSLFEVLGTRLAPMVRLDFETEGNCRGGGGGLSLGCADYSLAEADFGGIDTGFPGEVPGVDVVDQGQVGPYDFTVLQADTADVLMTWLADNEYAVPSTLSDVLQPYLAEDAHFLAVRLSKTSDTGDIAPLGWRYRGDSAAIPIQLTSIAAAPDLRLEVSVFGGARAVPESYLHVTINEANLDWFTGGTNYYDVVSRAADQAGGHAFATDYAGPTSDLAGTLWTVGQESDAAALAATTDPAAFANLWNSMAIRPNANVQAALALHVDMPNDIGQLSAALLQGVDLVALADDLEVYVFEPLRKGEDLLALPWVTRLSSSLDADEMTVDPVFVLNPDMPPVSNRYEATLVTQCNGKRRGEAPRRLELADGRAYRLPPTGEMSESDSDYWLANASTVEAVLIERTGKSGLAEVVSDLTEDAWADADGFDKKCGCSPSSAPFAGSILAILGAALARRRRS